MLTHPLVSWRSHMHTGQCQENWWSQCKPTIHGIIKSIEYLSMYHLATLYTVTSCFLWILWLKSGPQSQPTRKGLGNNLAWKCLAGMLRFLNSANILFQIFNAIGQVLLQFSKFLCSIVLYSRFLSLIELEHWLAEVMFLPSSTLMAVFQCSRHFRARIFPATSSRVGSGVHTNFGCLCTVSSSTILQITPLNLTLPLQLRWDNLCSFYWAHQKP